jgi:hypothetical protein
MPSESVERAGNATFTPTHLALPFGLIGFAGAWYVADYYRLPTDGRGEDARALLVFAIPLAGAVVGALLSGGSVSRKRWIRCMTAVVATSAAGWLIGAVTGAEILRGNAADAAAVGAITSLVFLPVIALIGWLARSVGRARLGSIVDGADRRGPWAVTATCIAVGRIPTRFAITPVQLTSTLEPSGVSLAIAVLAVVALLGVTLFDVIDLARVKHAFYAMRAMSERDPATGLPCEHTVDVGIGAEEHEELFGGPAYRSVERPLRVVRGSPERGVQALRRACIRSAAFTVVAAAGVVASLVHW